MAILFSEKGVVIATRNRIRDIRLSKEMTQKELARKAGMSQTTISDMENSMVNITEKQLDKLADALGVEKGEILLDLLKVSAIIFIRVAGILQQDTELFSKHFIEQAFSLWRCCINGTT
jgi:transcriptional regulator with XRE-family HTH domain